MDIPWWLHKHLYLIFLLLLNVLVNSTAALSTTSGDEATEEPEESHTTTTTNFFGFTAESINSNLNNTTIFPTRETPTEDFDGARRESGQGRALPPVFSWKTASRMLTKGLRLFRDSLLEGAKVAHMFKEDVGEGVSSIMRQNRGVKNDQSKQDGSSSSFFDSQLLREGVLGGILRFMGVNSKQMGVIALNVLIIVAEWITSSMLGQNDAAGATSRMIKTNLLQWASTGHNSQVEKLLSEAKSHSLPEKLIAKLSEKTGNNTSCVQLLLCKMTPVIHGLQDTVKDQMGEYGPQNENILRNFASKHGNRNKKESRGFLATSQFLFDIFMDHLPPKEKMLDFGDLCETKFPQCQLLKFNSLKE